MHPQQSRLPTSMSRGPPKSGSVQKFPNYTVMYYQYSEGIPNGTDFVWSQCEVELGSMTNTTSNWYTVRRLAIDREKKVQTECSGPTLLAALLMWRWFLVKENLSRFVTGAELFSWVLIVRMTMDSTCRVLFFSCSLKIRHGIFFFFAPPFCTHVDWYKCTSIGEVNAIFS